jgi:hypothetical protein
MDATPKIQEQPVSKRRLLAQLIALFLFFIVCGDFSYAKFMAYGGGYSQICKIALFLLVLCRLAWQIYKHTFRFSDYFIYFAVAIAFCIWLDYEFDHIMFTR